MFFRVTRFDCAYRLFDMYMVSIPILIENRENRSNRGSVNLRIAIVIVNRDRELGFLGFLGHTNPEW